MDSPAVFGPPNCPHDAGRSATLPPGFGDREAAASDAAARSNAAATAASDAAARSYITAASSDVAAATPATAASPSSASGGRIRDEPPNVAAASTDAGSGNHPSSPGLPLSCQWQPHNR